MQIQQKDCNHFAIAALAQTQSRQVFYHAHARCYRSLKDIRDMDHDHLVDTTDDTVQVL